MTGMERPSHAEVLALPIDQEAAALDVVEAIGLRYGNIAIVVLQTSDGLSCVGHDTSQHGGFHTARRRAAAWMKKVQATRSAFNAPEPQTKCFITLHACERYVERIMAERLPAPGAQRERMVQQARAAIAKAVGARVQRTSERIEYELRIGKVIYVVRRGSIVTVRLKGA